MKWYHIWFTFADQNFKQFLKYVFFIFIELINRCQCLNDRMIALVFIFWLKFEAIIFYLPFWLLNFNGTRYSLQLIMVWNLCKFTVSIMLGRFILCATLWRSRFKCQVIWLIFYLFFIEPHSYSFWFYQ